MIVLDGTGKDSEGSDAELGTLDSSAILSNEIFDGQMTIDPIGSKLNIGYHD